MEEYDLIIVGAGPAGLSAAINGASELNRVLLIDSGKKEDGVVKDQLGGQVVGSTLIENYPGFPDGISGCQMVALFAKQARNLGAHIRCPERVDSLTLDGDMKILTTKEGGRFQAKAVILATGLSYKKLEAPGVIELMDKGVRYGAPVSSPDKLGACTICVVGSANSAGQAVMHLAKNSQCTIKVLIRGKKTIADQMSKYLVDRIMGQTNVELLNYTSISQVCGTNRLESVVLDRFGEIENHQIDHLFVFIGAEPKTSWLQGVVMMDERNFILTDRNVSPLPDGERERFLYETSISGVFAVGDGRLGSVKRVTAGAGEGGCVIPWVHQYLASIS